jgi:hypothetical protein
VLILLVYELKLGLDVDMMGLTCDSMILVFEYPEYEYGDVVLVYIDGRNGEGRLNGFDVIFVCFCYFEYCYMFIYFYIFYIC